MENGKDLYHLLEMDDLMNVVGGATTVNTRDIHVCNPSPDPIHIIDDDGNHHYAPTPSPDPSPAPEPGTDNPGNPPNNSNDDGGNGDCENPDGDTSEPGNPVDGNNPPSPGNPVDDNNPPADNSDNDGDGNDSSGDTSDNGDDETGGNINLPTDDDGNSETGTGESEGQTNTPPAANNTTQTTQAADAGPKPLSPSERARMALFSKRKSSEDDFYNDAIGGTKKDILDKYTNKKPSSLVVASDIRGQDVTFDDFKVDGMDISIKREHDGYGNKFDSVRTIETVKLANGQVVKCNIQDMVGANAESKAFADEHKGMTLPDGKYYFTAKKLTKQSDGTYNSDCFQNTLRLQTKDSNIPKNIRDDINSKYYLFHATEYKKGFIPKKGNRIWINPWSAGCISSITGGQSTHDDFMNMLTGITPENINVTITSKRHVDI
ncbi:hypothetical protein E4O03_04985 [Treponema sp. OMZ 792]|uniref:hypothetical protein n=1 Tax=unclassified Treponema TaxID=2638727 RepID=UPI0020A42A94|nr:MULTISPECIES: hypothetical protein [unclassified Treponema]UTC76063.1 hypothetical protein E4O03_04985 [Treponema sp. OMZ 792]UTC80064.1 hypothetical protein E4O07_05005 [Treponema sp. OMZ 798]